jgi:hypothetical protein
MALLGRAWSAYSAALVARPLPTKIASGVAIYTLGDTSAQGVEWYARAHERLGADPRAAPEAFRWNRWRTLRMCLYGGVWLSPFLHVWYRSLDAMLVGRALFAGRAPLLAASKLALDQSFAAVGRKSGRKEEEKKKRESTLGASARAVPKSADLG